jgi:multiple sugar transport system permease protein
MAHHRPLRPLLLNGGALICAGVLFFPIYWLVITSLRAPADLESSTSLIPNPVNAEGYAAVLSDPSMLQYLLNSIIYGCGATVLTTLLAAPAAYALARLPVRGKTTMVFALLILQTFPAIMLAMPLFVMFTQFGMINNRLTVIIAIVTKSLPFAILLLRPYLVSLPREIEDAARIDGASLLTTLWRIVLPLTLPGLVTIAAFTFLQGWGDLLFSLTLLTKESLRPISLGLYQYMGQYGIDWNQLMAASVVASVPAVVVFFFAQRYLVSGLTSGAINE